MDIKTSQPLGMPFPPPTPQQAHWEYPSVKVPGGISGALPQREGSSLRTPSAQVWVDCIAAWNDAIEQRSRPVAASGSSPTQPLSVRSNLSHPGGRGTPAALDFILQPC